MEQLVCNGRTLYRRSSSLVRTPIYKTLTLQPVGMAAYDVGSDYVQSLPTRDFPTSSGGVYAIAAGHKMRKAYLLRQLPPSAVQIWRNQNGWTKNLDSGYVFYNGNYSTATGLLQGASFMRCAAYRFELPASYAGFTTESVQIKTRHHGVALFSGSCAQRQTDSRRYPTFAQDAATNLLPANSEWRRGWSSFNFGFFPESALLTSDACQMYGMCQQTVQITNSRTDACDNRGAANGFPLWQSWPGGTVTYVDGTVMNAPSNPAYQQVDGNAAMNSALDSLLPGRVFYLAFFPPVSDSGSDDRTVTNQDYPYYYYSGSGSIASNWWLCERMQIDQITLRLALHGN